MHAQRSERKQTDKSKENENNKRPPNAYLLFCQAKRPELIEKCPNQDAIARNQILSQMWKQMSEEEKQPYQEKAHELHTQFKEANPEFKYKQKKKKSRKGMVPDYGELDSFQMLNHMFQNNPLLFQQMISEKDSQGRPNVCRLFFTE